MHYKTKLQYEKMEKSSDVPAAVDYQFPEPKSHHWPEQPQTLVNSKVNHPT